MTPRQAQVALASFVLVAGGIVFNALYMQGDVGPSRRTTGKDMPPPAADHGKVPLPAKAPRAGEAAKRTALLKPDSAKADIVPDGLPDEAGADTIRGIQRELTQRGFGPVASDGIMRPVTRAAIMAYEFDYRLPLTGEATEALLSRLVLGATATADVSGGREVRSPHADAIIRQVQRLLAASGYRPGAIDGRLSADTVTAIRAFEEDQGLTAKGRVSAEVMSRLQEGATKLKAAEAR
jgi:peptidoglycan hydrolase-like protein with peptidoglycan-binding domain